MHPLLSWSGWIQAFYKIHHWECWLLSPLKIWNTEIIPWEMEPDGSWSDGGRQWEIVENRGVTIGESKRWEGRWSVGLCRERLSVSAASLISPPLTGRNCSSQRSTHSHWNQMNVWLHLPQRWTLDIHSHAGRWGRAFCFYSCRGLVCNTDGQAWNFVILGSRLPGLWCCPFL